MSNRSHSNSAHIGMNLLKKKGKQHSSAIRVSVPNKTHHAIFTDDAIKFLKKMPSSSVQLILIDPPYNLDLATWDTFDNYLDWAKEWIREAERVLTDTGSFVVFGGYQYQNGRIGDLMEIMHYMKHQSKLLFVNLIVWYYKSGMGAHRFFSNRHEGIAWYTKSKKYYFNLDDVRIQFDEKTKARYKKDKRLNPASVDKGKNPTNVWEIERLVGGSLERVGHPTQKPLAVIRRIVRAMSYPNSLVLDFFAGSGTTGRVCIEERRNCILVDNDKKSIEYFKKHIGKMNTQKEKKDFELQINGDLNKFLDNMKAS